VEEFNAKGGVLGRKVELLVRDDKLKPEEAAKRAKELLEKDKVHLMAGSLGSHTQLAINEQCKYAKTIFMTISQSNEIAQAPDASPYTFTEGQCPHMATQGLGKWALENLGKKWFYLIADYSYGWQLLDGYRLVGQKYGGVDAGLIKHPLGAVDYTKYFPTILAAAPQVLVVGNYGKDQLNSLKQIHEFGLKKKMKIVCSVPSFTARQGAGDEVFEDVYGELTFYWQLGETVPTAKAFVANYKKRWNVPPSDFSGYAYGGIKDLLSAVERAGELDAKKIILKLEGHVYDNYKGKQWIRAWDHRAMQDLYIVKSKSARERTGEWDFFKIVHTVKADDSLERKAEEKGLKADIPLSRYLEKP
jgi:branched-chain amino acid transport system substrate-binding protein